MLLTVRIFEQMYAGLFFIFIRSEASLFFFFLLRKLSQNGRRFSPEKHDGILWLTAFARDGPGRYCRAGTLPVAAG